MYLGQTMLSKAVHFLIVPFVERALLEVLHNKS